MKDVSETLINLSLVSLVFFSILLLGYGLNLYTFILPIIFFLSIFLPYLYFKKKVKNEIYIYFMPFVYSHLAKNNKFIPFEEGYYKKFPCWLVCSLFFSAIFIFKIPILFIGRFFYKGWQNPLNQYDSGEENSQNELVSEFLRIFYIFQIFFALILLIINPILAFPPILVAFYTIFPIPGNIGYDLYFLDFKKWLSSFTLVIVSTAILLFVALVFLGVEITEGLGSKALW